MIPEPFFERLTIQLSEDPTTEVDLFRKKFLTVEVKYDPKDALASDQSDAQTGEHFIAYLLDAFDAVRKEFAFNMAPIDDAIATFRAQNYKVWYTTARGTLKERGLTCEVSGGVGPNTTEITLCVKNKAGAQKHITAGVLDKPNKMYAQGYTSVKECENGIALTHNRPSVFEDLFVSDVDLNLACDL